MTKGILTIFFAFSMFVISTAAILPQPPPAPETKRLTYSIEAAPSAIKAMAEALGIQRIAYVAPKYYTRGNADRTVRTFNREKAENNLEAIKAICDGAVWIITDIEKKHRDAVRHPDNFDDAEVKEAVNQYIACWSWFRSHWPDALIFEWNLSNAREPGRNTFAEKLILKHLDGIAVSIFYRNQTKWLRMREAIVAHANSLVEGSDKIVIAGIHEKYNAHHDDGTTTSTPIPREIVDVMVEVALEADVVMLWSPTYNKQFPPVGDELHLANARVVEMLAEMRLQAGEQTP